MDVVKDKSGKKREGFRVGKGSRFTGEGKREGLRMEVGKRGKSSEWEKGSVKSEKRGKDKGEKKGRVKGV